MTLLHWAGSQHWDLLPLQQAHRPPSNTPAPEATLRLRPGEQTEGSALAKKPSLIPASWLSFLAISLIIFLFAWWATSDYLLATAITFLYLSSPIVFGLSRWVMTENFVFVGLLTFSFIPAWLITKGQKFANKNVELLRDLFDYSISIGTVHNQIGEAVQKARKINKSEDLSPIEASLLDEIFQGNSPVLAGVDARSTYCFLLEEAEHRVNGAALRGL
jgi:hypothetical protein